MTKKKQQNKTKFGLNNNIKTHKSIEKLFYFIFYHYE
jgi:hypothetical protein